MMVAFNPVVLLGLLLQALAVSALGTLTKPTATVISLAFCSAQIGVSDGFFGFFRRRTKAKAPSRIPQGIEEMSVGSNEQSFFQNNMFPNQFGGGGGAGFFQQQNAQRPPQSPFQGHSFQSGSFQDQVMQQMAQQNIPQHMQDEVMKQIQQNPPVSEDMNFNPGDGDSPGVNAEEAESFFTLLSETDESQCISRLICEMGADPVNSGEFGLTISEMIGNLRNFPPGSKVSYYNDILQLGSQRGLSACFSRFSTCDNESLQLVKNAQVGE